MGRRKPMTINQLLAKDSITEVFDEITKDRMKMSELIAIYTLEDKIYYVVNGLTMGRLINLLEQVKHAALHQMDEGKEGNE